jgi:hypothetical protein
MCVSCLATNPSDKTLVESDTRKFRRWTGFLRREFVYLQVFPPYCQTCASKLSRTRTLGVAGAFIGALVAVLVSKSLDLTGISEIGVLVAFTLPGGLVWQYGGVAVPLSSFDEKTIVFKFKHPQFAGEFRRLNTHP